MPNPAVTYSSYLKVDELLALQQPRSTGPTGPEHDEMLFIVIHQVYELWFKELLHEFDRVRVLLEGDEPHRAQHTLKRILTILKVMVAQLDILETMTPLEFLTFRERLEAASGFQSDQFRQLEFVRGLKSDHAIARFAENTRARTALQQRYEQPTIWDAFLRYLAREGYPVPAAQLQRNITKPVEPSPEIQQILIDIYRKDP
jgi:tryptophan 2,3-dioxygenase